jgi:hypothetical protein
VTLPHEERAAITYTENFLFKLLDPKKSPKVPMVIRQEARRLLKHYPTKSRVGILFDMEERIQKIKNQERNKAHEDDFGL